MDEKERLAEPFEEARAHLREVAYRMLGSRSEADDAVQETWLRLTRVDTSGVENFKGWLTTVVSRVCLDMLRSRRARPEETLAAEPPEAPLTAEDEDHPEHGTLLADAIGPALMVVLDTLAPAERLAFVLHDLFGMTFDEIAGIVGRSPVAARQLASRARRRIQGAPSGGQPDPRRQREVVDAFLAAARAGSFDALLAVLDEDVVIRADDEAVRLGASGGLRGARPVAEALKRRSGGARRAMVDGVVGAAWAPDGRPRAVFLFTVVGERIAEIQLVADPARLAGMEVVLLGG